MVIIIGNKKQKPITFNNDNKKILDKGLLLSVIILLNAFLLLKAGLNSVADSNF